MDKVLVTGAGGFIGSHLVESLVKQGRDVKVLLRYNSKNNWGWLEQSPIIKEIEIVTGDIRDYDLLNSSLKDCDEVFHLAALIGIPYSYLSPLAYIRTNIEGTYNVLEASRLNNLRKVIITSTSETYGSARYVPIDESHPIVGQSPYSASKIAADQLALSYYNSFNLPIKIVRPFNTYGPRQSARAFIPSVITQLISGQKGIKTGNLFPTRDYTYVQDTVAGIIAIADSDKLFGEITNIGTNTEISMRELLNIIMSLLNININISEEEKRIRPSKSEVNRLICNNKKILTHTTWRPQYTLLEGLEKTIEFIKTHQKYYKNEIYNI